MYLDRVDLRQIPLLERKERLAKILAKPDPTLIYGAHIAERGAELFRSLCQRNYEGIIAKRGDRPYRSKRSGDWVKVKCLQEQEFVVAGYTRSDVVARPFSSLILALNDADGLRYAGHVGTGFSHQELRRLRAVMTPLERATSSLKGKLPSEVQRRGWIRDCPTGGIHGVHQRRHAIHPIAASARTRARTLCVRSGLRRRFQRPAAHVGR